MNIPVVCVKEIATVMRIVLVTLCAIKNMAKQRMRPVRNTGKTTEDKLKAGDLEYRRIGQKRQQEQWSDLEYRHHYKKTINKK